MPSNTRITLAILALLGIVIVGYYAINSGDEEAVRSGEDATQGGPVSLPVRSAPPNAASESAGRRQPSSGGGGAPPSAPMEHRDRSARTALPPPGAEPALPLAVQVPSDDSSPGGAERAVPSPTADASFGPGPDSPGTPIEPGVGSPSSPSTNPPVAPASQPTPSPRPDSPQPAARQPASDGPAPSTPAGATRPVGGHSPLVPRFETYTVVAGDNMWTIAQKWFGDGSKWDLIAKLNLVDPQHLQVGQTLRMPPKTATRDEPAAPAPPAGAAVARVHTVVSGDTLRRIAQRHYGDANKWQPIYDANRAVIGPDPHELQVGMKLTIPPMPAPAR